MKSVIFTVLILCSIGFLLYILITKWIARKKIKKTALSPDKIVTLEELALEAKRKRANRQSEITSWLPETSSTKSKKRKTKIDKKTIAMAVVVGIAGILIYHHMNKRK